MANGKLTLQDGVSGFGATLQSGTLSGDVVHTLPSTSSILAPTASPELTGTPTVNGVSFSGFSGFKNYIINGNFDVWQRGTSFAFTANNANANVYHSDRFCSASTFANGAVSISKNNIIYNGSTYNSAKCMVTTAYNTSGVGSAYRHFCYFMEGVHSSVVNRGFTFSFLFNTNVAGTYTVSFRCEGNITSTYKTRFTAISGVQKITITVPANTITTPALDNNIGLQVYIAGVAGTSYGNLSTTLNQWDSTVTTPYYPNEFNWAGSVNNYIEIAQVQLEEGSVATPFEHRPIGLELSLCQRYYRKWGYAGGAQNVSTTQLRFNIDQIANMRTIPTLTNAASGDGSGVIYSTFGSSTSTQYFGGNCCVAGSYGIVEANVTGLIPGVSSIIIVGTASAEL